MPIITPPALNQQEQRSSETKRAISAVRLLIGLVQSALLYVLSLALATNGKSWLTINPAFLVSLLLVAVFVPLIFIQGAGNMRSGRLLIWGALATILIAMLGYYSVWRLWPALDFISANNFPSFKLVIFIIIALFISHSLIISGDKDRRFMAHYTTYFDVAWKHGIQVVLSCVFLGAFWLLLWLGASLFKLINLYFIAHLINKNWFAIPISTLVFTAGLHISDIRASLVRGTRTLVLVFLSWLLPLMTIIVTGFLISLIFTGLTPLWQTKMAAKILLVAAAILITLINATYQDGSLKRMPPKILRYMGTLAALILMPLVVLAAYALWLRVVQYGWIANRVFAAAFLLVAIFYALGYIGAVFKSGLWLQFITVWNFVAALLILLVIMALFTPLADPARLSVANQVMRLQKGQITPQKFDFNYLSASGERFGNEALMHLQNNAQGPQAEYIRTQAKAILSLNNRVPTAPINKDIITIMLNIHTPDGHLPPSFLQQNWNVPQSNDFPSCLHSTASTKCDVWMEDINHDGKKEIVVMSGTSYEGAQLVGFQYDKQGGVWQMIGKWKIPYSCSEFITAARAGKFNMILPKPPIWPDMEVMGRRFLFLLPDSDINKSCIQKKNHAHL